MTIVIKYTLFAGLATLANLLTQELSIQFYDAVYSVYVAMIAGTLVGLIAKYLLDKKYIFAFETASAHEDLKTFIAYAVTGVVTTLLFWSFEIGFEQMIGGKPARYLGAIIGLAIGYGVKYRLDKHFVFSKQVT